MAAALAFLAWWEAVEIALRISASIMALVAGYYAIRYHKARADWFRSNHPEGR